MLYLCILLIRGIYIYIYIHIYTYVSLWSVNIMWMNHLISDCYIICVFCVTFTSVLLSNQYISFSLSLSIWLPHDTHYMWTLFEQIMWKYFVLVCVSLVLRCTGENMSIAISDNSLPGCAYTYIWGTIMFHIIHKKMMPHHYQLINILICTSCHVLFLNYVYWIDIDIDTYLDAWNATTPNVALMFIDLPLCMIWLRFFCSLINLWKNNYNSSRHPIRYTFLFVKLVFLCLRILSDL